MVLQPLEFSDCLKDDPLFREKLAEHERELEKISKFIKTLVHHGRDVYAAAKQFSKAQKALAKDLMEFKFECIGTQLTDDESIISQSLKKFGEFIEKIEEHRDMLISSAEEQFVKPLENFKKENIVAAKDEKKNFDKQTSKYYQSLEKYLGMKTKINDSTLQEADTQVEFEKKAFYTSSMKYVLKLQEVQEKKKFEFVEILLSYLLGWLTFYHQGYVDLEDFRKYDENLRHLLQTTRSNFQVTNDKATNLMSKLLNENKGLKPQDHSFALRKYTKEGYLYLMEKKTLGTTSWNKYYCQYKKETKEFHMILYNQMGGKLSDPEHYTLDKCVRRASESIEKRFCFDITVKEKSVPMTFQALSEDDRRQWLDAMDGKEPTYLLHNIKQEESKMDDLGFSFIKKSLAAIESRGLQEQGLYRVVGVNSKVNNLLKQALDAKKFEKVNYDDPSVWETKTLTSAVKSYLRSLPEPLMTFKLHEKFIKAAKQESKTLRKIDIHKFVHQLPDSNFQVLELLIGHLHRLSCHSEINKMTAGNLGVCFGPSLMRSEEESMAAIMDFKFCNIVIELLISHYEEIFKSQPDDIDPSQSKLGNNSETHSLSAQDNQMRSSTTSLSMTRSEPSRVIYSNQAPVHPQANRNKMRPVHVYNSNIGGFEVHSSTSSSTESLNSAKNNLSPRGQASMISPQTFDPTAGRRGSNNKEQQHTYSNISVNQIGHVPGNHLDTYTHYSAFHKPSKFNINLSGNDSPAFGSIKKRSSNDYSGSLYPSLPTSMTGSITSLPGSSSKPTRRTVRTKYRCTAERDTELSFEANQHITNVRPSYEPGWLEGTLDGRTGVIPENYVEYLD